jgi:molecular chaperone GrpE (heat shock protein)
MTDGRIPEGRKPLTDADIAALTRRLAGTAVDYKELYEAAKRDAEEAEAYAAELEAKLAKADVAALERILKERGRVFDEMVEAAEDAAGKDVSFNVVVGLALRAALAELKGDKDE